MRSDGEEAQEPTPMVHRRDAGSLRDDSFAEGPRGAGGLHARPVHDPGAGDARAPLADGQARERGSAVPRDRAADGRVDGDRDARGERAAPRRGRLRDRAPADLLKVAVPVKGRLREPSFKLLEDAGLGPEQPGERALAFPCRNAPVEVLLVRAADIPEYVQDSVVDCGITGLDLVRERGARVGELVSLGFGSCRLEAAVLDDSPVQAIEDLAGATVATVYPRLTAELLPV